MLRHRIRKHLKRWLNPVNHPKKLCPNPVCMTLDNAIEDSMMIVTCNMDYQTLERGLYTGSQIKVLRNQIDEPNMIVAVGDARYVLDRRIAKDIRVKPCT